VAAFAETRWVLWYQDVVVVEGQEPAVVWSQSGPSTTKAACKEERRKEIGGGHALCWDRDRPGERVALDVIPLL
jgi:hypothetical protein